MNTKKNWLNFIITIVLVIITLSITPVKYKDTAVTSMVDASVTGTVINVPGDMPTIQAGIDTASDGDIVLIAPGTYNENLRLEDKTIELASWFHTTGQEEYIEQTVIDGGGNTVIEVRNVGYETKIIGLTIQNGEDGIYVYSKIHILNNHIIGNVDGIDYQGGGGICSNNLFANNIDDGIDLDGSAEVEMTNNIVRDNQDDGIEIRLHPYSGDVLDIVIRENIISGNQEDGIQLIDYSDMSDRTFLIERNVLVGNAIAAIGFMEDGNTVEDLRGAPIPERVSIINNTFVSEQYGVVGGANAIILNNIFKDIQNSALRRVAGDSVASYNLFWNNGSDYEETNIDLANTLFGDPLINSNYYLTANSPAIDAGTASYTWQGETVLDMPETSYMGLAPDMGAYEGVFERSWEFAVCGDTRSGHDYHRENIQGIIKKMPNSERITVWNLGDVTQDGTDSQWQTLHDIIAPLNINWNKTDPPGYMSSVGNHDTRQSGWQDRWAYYLPSQVGLSAYPGITAHDKGLYGSVKYDNVIWIWVDSDSMPDGQEAFLEDTLIEASQDPDVVWKFVMFHHPPVVCGGKHGEWVPGHDWHDLYFKPYGVDIIFLAHEHFYERLCPILSAAEKTCDENNRGNIIGDSEGVVYIISAGGGASTRDVGSCSFLEQGKSVHHFLEIEVSGSTLNIKAWDTDNGGASNPTLIDDFTILKSTVCIDNDNDGYGNFDISACALPELDCDDNNLDINPGAVEICDGIDNNCDSNIDEGFDVDEDTYTTCGGDCDDNNALEHPNQTWYEDADDDRYSSGNIIVQCERPIGYKAEFELITLSGDCDDNNALVHPNLIWYEDADGDGYPSGNLIVQCERPTGYKAESELITLSGDCNDRDPGISGQSTWYADTDADMYGDANSTTLACFQPGGYVPDNTDCNDSDSAISPDGVEACDGIDNDCDAGTGDGSGEIWYGGSCDGPDADLCEEGIYGCTNGTQSCSDITGDTVETCGDGIDNDCDGTVDEPNVLEQIEVSVYPEADTTVNSGNPSKNKGADLTLEVDGSPTRSAYFRFDITEFSGNVESVKLRLEVANPSPVGGTIHSISDNSWNEDTVTFNTRPDIDGPALDTLGAVDVGDIVEFDVTPAVDGNGTYSFAIVSDNADKVEYLSREDLNNPPVLIITINEENSPYYCDDDLDGYIDPTGDGAYTGDGCVPAGCQVMPGDDCNDNDSAIRPGGVEVCDGIDNDCDELIDDNDPGITGQSTWYADTDSDMYGDANSTTLACNQPGGYVPDNTDCNDSDSAISPGTVEVCDGVDNNCDSNIDEGFDVDGDTYTTCGGDCDDNMIITL
jgi:hypothetical protein